MYSKEVQENKWNLKLMKEVMKIMNTVAEAETKSLTLSDYINRMKNLGFEDDQIQSMIKSLVKRGDIAIEPTKSMVKFTQK